MLKYVDRESVMFYGVRENIHRAVDLPHTIKQCLSFGDRDLLVTEDNQLVLLDQDGKVLVTEESKGKIISGGFILSS